MTSVPEFQHFAANLADNRMMEIDKAVACLWFHTHIGHACAMSASQLASCMTEIGLTANVNVSRLAKNLCKSKLTVKGSECGTFRISPSQGSQLDERFAPFLKHRRVKVSDDLLPDEVIEGSQKYLKDLGHQVNGTYGAGFYDACAVLCRRMIESLLVSCFEYAGELASVEKPDGTLEMLDSLIRKAKSGQHFRLPRGTAKSIDKIKEVGDTAAHDRYHLTTKQDIDEFRVSFRKVISHLMALSGTPSNTQH